MKKVVILALVGLLLSLVPASATVPIIQIQVPREVTEGDEVTLRIVITHRDNDKNHHINFVWLYHDNSIVKEWTWSGDNFVTEDQFELTYTTVLWHDATFLAKAHCTLHGNAQTVAKVVVHPYVEKPKAILLANEIDYTRAGRLVEFLEENGFEVIHIAASELDQYKIEELIIILGGPDAPDGVGDVVKSVLDEREQQLVRLGVHYFLEEDLWAPNQKVFIFAGKDRDQTRDAHTKYMGRVLE
jgi:desulfoferrodoxin (superoxide reductase-like protein)